MRAGERAESPRENTVQLSRGEASRRTMANRVSIDSGFEAGRVCPAPVQHDDRPTRMQDLSRHCLVCGGLVLGKVGASEQRQGSVHRNEYLARLDVDGCHLASRGQLYPEPCAV